MRRILIPLVCLIVLCGLRPIPAPAQPAAPATRAAGFAGEFAAGYTTLMAIPDPLPRVQRLLTSPRLGQIWNNGLLAQAIRKHDPTVAIPDLQAVWMIILRNARWVPSEMAVGLAAAAQLKPNDATVLQIEREGGLMYISFRAEAR